MRRRLGIVAMVTALIAGAFGQQATNYLGDDPAKFDEKLDSAALRRDVEFFKAVHSDDVRFSHGTGVVWDKARWLETVPTSTATVRDIDSVEVEPHGDVIETVGHLHVKSTNPKRPEYHVWYVRVYARRNGFWQLLSNRTVRWVDGALPPQ